MELEVLKYWDNLPEEHHQQLFDTFNKLLADSELVAQLQVSQEPYETPMTVIKVKCSSVSRPDIIKIIGGLTRKNKFYVRFTETLNHHDQTLCELQIDDFYLGSLNLAKFDFYQRFRHSVQFPSASKSRMSIAFDHEVMCIEFAISNLPIVEEQVEEATLEDRETIKPTTEVYQLKIKFSMIEKNQIVIHEHAERARDSARHQGSGKSLSDIYFLVKSPPELWRTKQCLKRVEALNPDILWTKTVNLKSGNETFRKVDLSSLLGGSRVLKISIDKTDPKYSILVNSLESNGFIIKYGNVSKTTPRQLPYCFRTGTKDFNADWYLQALYSLGIHTKLQFTPEFRSYILSVEKNENFMPALERAYIKIMDNQNLEILRTVKHFYENPRKLDESTPRNNCHIRKIVVTPTRQVYLPLSMMHENRILRQFDREFALTLTFRNDDHTFLNDQFSSKEFIQETMLETLSKGIRISDRVYRFLGCSNSQQRNHSCWLYAKDNDGNDSESILKWVGNLGSVHIPGKFISRVGQCFSRTKPVDLSQFEDLVLKLQEPDVIGGDRNYCFTDGVGRISKEMLIAVFSHLDEPYIPSAIQIRLGGCKGMLVLDPTLEGKQILCRQSMDKFDCDHRTLELVRLALPLRLKLNRQIITLLSLHRGDLDSREAADCKKNRYMSGIKGGSQEFTGLLLKMLFDLAETFVDDQIAAESLGSRTSFCCPFMDLVKAGLSVTEETFFRNMSLVVARETVDNIIKSFHVELPVDEARNMFGVVDETGTLEYGQVFVQYSSDITKPGQEPIVVTGDVLVSKMPCLHPGDVRVLHAVDVNQLHHIVDCIVFPSKGPRPHPDEMAGSDLDGDEYFVTWRPQLLLRFPNSTPMDYTPAAPPPVVTRTNSVTQQDMIRHFVSFVSSDQIGPVASRHLVFADQEGLYSKQCLDLCQLHSDVIDSGKTGQSTGSALNQRQDLRLHKYPDFLNKVDHKDTYKSNSVLGRFYRISRRVHVILSDELREGVEVNGRFVLKGCEEFLEDAEVLRNMYEDSLDHILSEYGIADEVELLSGCFIELRSPLSKAEGDQRKNVKLREVIHDKITGLAEQIREKFFTDLGIEIDKITMSSLKKASACYLATYNQKRKLISFPWIFGDLLVESLKSSSASSAVEHHPYYYARLDDSINAISSSDISQYLRKFRVNSNGIDTKERILFILLKWYNWTQLSCPKRREFVRNVITLMQDVQSASPSVLLISVIKNLGFDLKGKNEEDFSREIVMAVFRLTLHCDWKAMIDDSNEGRETTQPIAICKYRWEKLKERSEEFCAWLQTRYPKCAFRLRAYKRAGMLQVTGPSLQLFDYMDDFENCYYRFTNKK